MTFLFWCVIFSSGHGCKSGEQQQQNVGGQRIGENRGSALDSPGRYNLTIQSMIEFHSKMIQFNF